MFIELKNAVKRYGKGETEVYALDHAELSLEQGKICVILGPSGSGKSTLLNMLGGVWIRWMKASLQWRACFGTMCKRRFTPPNPLRRS